MTAWDDRSKRSYGRGAPNPRPPEKGRNMKYRLSIDELERISKSPWLTDRERIVFDLYYRRGWAIEAIAAEIYVSRGTVNNVLKSIRSK